MMQALSSRLQRLRGRSFHGPLFTLALSLASVASASTAQAQVRLNGLVGVSHFAAQTPNAPSAVATARLEGTFGALPWLGLGGYLGAQSDLSGPTGSSFGAIAALRPHLPGSPVDPFGFASIGRLRFPVGGDKLASGWDAQLGVGLSLHASEMVDFEARAAWVSFVSRDDASPALGPSGYALSTGLSLHF